MPRSWIPLLTGVIIIVNVVLIAQLVMSRFPNPGGPFTNDAPAFVVELPAGPADDASVQAPATGNVPPRDEPDMPVSSYAVHLEWRLVDTHIDGHDLVETYREFEIYKDHRNRTVKEVPTSYYQYLRYNIAEEDD